MKTLIVVDVQNDFVYGPLGTAHAVNLVERLKPFISNWEGKIIFTKDTHDNNYMSTNEGKHLPIKHCIQGTEGWKIVEGIVPCEYKPSQHIWTVTKYTFGHLGLKEYISNEDEIYVCGLCTDICVIANAIILKTIFPDKEIHVIEDLCEGTTVTRHDEAIDVMKSLHIDVLQVHDLE